MGRYVVRRLLQLIPVFFGATFIIYFLMIALGDPLKNLSPQQRQNPAYMAYLTRAVQPRRPVHRPVPEVHRRHLHR